LTESGRPKRGRGAGAPVAPRPLIHINTAHEFILPAGYLFEIGIGLDIAYKHLNDDGVDTDMLGTLSTYGIEF
jgi:hypothetical protein|tara:strand:- start:44 stop:262 length:219 start_codon:yes stop_codon:yes gene_type:complete